MDKLSMHSKDIVEDNISKIAELFPNTLTEVIKDGKVTHAIDFDLLRQELSDIVVDGPAERYQFTWPDKRKSILLANSPISKTLRPCREESVDFDTTENLYIEGDNLDVLKIMQETYLGKVKMIYIDPPYNTGKDFIYDDNFAEGKDIFSKRNYEYDGQGNRLTSNIETNGRFHTDWLNMIFPRLYVARDLLTEDGVIFISIDDNEVGNLRKICDEIFGEKNFIAQLIWQNKKGGGNDSLHIAIEHEYIVTYAKNVTELDAFYEVYTEKYSHRYKEEDNVGKYYWDTFKRKSGKQYYPIECPDGTILEHDEDGNPISWLRSKSRFEQDKQVGEVRIISVNGKWSVQFKQRMPIGKKPRSIFSTATVIDDKGTTSSGSNDVFEYFKKDVFSNPKPLDLIKFLLGFGLGGSDLILDFFSGSGTLGEAILSANAEDGGKRRFIVVQIQENIDKMLVSSNANAKRVSQNAVAILNELNLPHVITELAKERIRRAGKKIKENQGLIEQTLDTGFRVLKLYDSNMQDVYYSPGEMQQSFLDDLEDNIKPDRTSEDLLFQVMLDLGVMLSSKIVEFKINGKKVFSVADGDLIACFDSNISDEVVTEIAKRKPHYSVFRDSGFAKDSVGANFDQIFDTYSPRTIRKVL